MNIFPQASAAEQIEYTAQAASRLRGEADRPIQASIVVPVNAQADLTTVLTLIDDLGEYRGPYAFEMILVINHYPPDSPPAMIEDFRAAGIRVVAEPSAKKPGEVVIVSARALGVTQAASNITIHFDADCRVPYPTALLDWYVETLQSRAQLAYTHVSFYDLRRKLSVSTKIFIHHLFRMIKRTLLGIPTTRGSNYAICRDTFIKLYQERLVSVDMQIGPAAKMKGAKIAYSGRKDLVVYTSGRRFKGGWGKIPRYVYRRLSYNLSSLSVLRKKGAGEAQSWNGFDRENKNRQELDPVKAGAGKPPMMGQHKEQH